MTQLKFGIIGCGRIALRHAELMQGFGTLVAACDIVEEKVAALAVKHNAQPYMDAQEMLAAHPDMDVIAVCSPNGLHAQHSILALAAGFHVLCEKPMALNVQDCGAMIHAAERASKRLFIVKQNRFNPPVAAVKKLIEENRLGKLYSVQLNCFWNRNDEYYQHSWKGTKDMDGGTLFTQFSHFIDLLYWMIGDVKNVHAFTGNYHHRHIIEFEDTGVVTLSFHNDVVGTINYTVNSFDKNMEGSLTIFGEKGTVKIGGQYLNELEYQCIDGYEIKDLPAGNPPNNYGKYFGSMSNHDKVYQNVADVLTKGGVIATHAYEGLKTVEIINRIYDAAENITRS